MTNKTSPTFSHSARTNILWHRRLGLSVFLLLIFLAISGFALNHSPALKLNQIALSNNWLLSWYGLEKAPAKGFQVDGQWLYHNGDAELDTDLGHVEFVINCSTLHHAHHDETGY